MSKLEKIDLHKEHKQLYSQRKAPHFVDVGKAQYLAVEGRGAPGGEVFQRGIAALYAMAYTIKMTRKFSGKQDYVVCKLEGQWWADDPQADLNDVPQAEWNWRLMIRTPDCVKSGELERARTALVEKGKGDGTEGVRLYGLTEGYSIQALHVGPYEREHETIAKLKEHAEGEGYELSGIHHEIYLSDPRRIAPERLKTIVRYPVVKKGS